MNRDASTSSTTERKDSHGWLLPVIALLAGAAAVLFWFNPAQFGFYPTCLFHRATGLLCPGCGSLRAMHQLLHGHLAEAFRCNALLMLSLPGLGWLAAHRALRRRRGQPAAVTIRPPWLWGALVVLLAFSVARNLPFHQLAWLAP